LALPSLRCARSAPRQKPPRCRHVASAAGTPRRAHSSSNYLTVAPLLAQSLHDMKRAVEPGFITHHRQQKERAQKIHRLQLEAEQLRVTKERERHVKLEAKREMKIKDKARQDKVAFEQPFKDFERKLNSDAKARDKKRENEALLAKRRLEMDAHTRDKAARLAQQDADYVASEARRRDADYARYTKQSKEARAEFKRLQRENKAAEKRKPNGLVRGRLSLRQKEWRNDRTFISAQSNACHLCNCAWSRSHSQAMRRRTHGRSRARAPQWSSATCRTNPGSPP